jgi:alpha-L-rhamnosidase
MARLDRSGEPWQVGAIAMDKRWCMVLLLVVGFVLMNVLVVGCAAPQASSIRDVKAPQHLRCEYLTDPRGIDETAPRLSWEMDDSRRGAAQRAYQILAGTSETALERDSGDLWDTGKTASDESAHIVYAGRPLRSGMQVFWKVRVWGADDNVSPWSGPAGWSMGPLLPADWDAWWIGEAATPPADQSEPLPPPRLRREFVISGDGGKVRRAVVVVTALGLYELRLNGERVGDHLLAPEWTDYHRRIQYQTYDVTALLRTGANALAAQLGNGWYAGRIGLAELISGVPKRGLYGQRPRLLIRLVIEFADGRTQTVISDDAWRVSTDGPIRVSDLLDGETYDARRETPGWDRPGFDDSAWRSAGVFEKVDAAFAGPRLSAQPNEPIRIVREIRPITITEPQTGVYVFDLGQNMAGWCRVRLRGRVGTTVTLRYAEVLNPEGTIYTANLRSALQTDHYTLRGGDLEMFEPHFTYHGFRYVEVTGLPEKPAIDDLIGCVFCSAATEAGRFECSSPMLNKLMENIVWTQRANLMSTPTDCPQRDERLGWMGDILAFAQTACFNMDMAAFFTKWLPDVRDAQTDDGRYPDFAPHPYDPAARFSSVPAWGDAGVFVPWCAYVNYGDKRMLAQHFDSARRWVDYVRQKNPDLLWKNNRGNDYGDWLNADTLKLEGWPASGAEVPKEVFATMFFARSTDLVARMADALGRRDDAERYRALACDIRAAFNRAYVAPDGRIQGHTQAGYAIALAFDLLPESQRAAATGYLLEGFQTYGGLISTGFHSTICLMNELTRCGRSDEAYRLINNRKMPSWGYAIDHGATTVWERWDGYVEGRGFQYPGMNSFSHYAIGSVGEWMYRTIIGINPDESKPGYKHFFLTPRPGGGLTWAQGEYHSLYGRIECAWRKADGRLTIDLTVPPNTTATVSVPTSDPAGVTEGGHSASTAPGVKFLGTEAGAACYLVPAGRYTFSAPCADAGRSR